jgi:hypothetical protein
MQLRYVTLPWLVELKLKEASNIMGYIGAKLTKLMLKHFVGEPMVKLTYLTTEGSNQTKVAKGSS